MSWLERVKGNPINWLLEKDSPGVRYLAMRDLLDSQPETRDLLDAKQSAHNEGPIAAILSKMSAEGYWSEPGPGYLPKYWSTVWSIITLAQLGASVKVDMRIARACEYLLEHSLTQNGQFTIDGTPSTTVDCLQGNLCTALLDLEYEDTRIDKAFEWMARSVTGEGIASSEDRQAPIRYYAGKCGPNFACGANNKLPCAWGAVKVMLAFSKLPTEKRTALIEGAIQQGVNFLLSVDPASSDYPTGWSNKPSGNWWKFGFPVFYVTDLLQNVEALARLGYGNDPRLARAIELILEKQDDQGRWALEYDYTGKTWVDYGQKKLPNKWVTLRALRVIKQAVTQS